MTDVKSLSVVFLCVLVADSAQADLHSHPTSSHTHPSAATDHTHSPSAPSGRPRNITTTTPSHTHLPSATDHTHTTQPHTHPHDVTDHTHSTVPSNTHQPNATDHTHSTLPTHTHQPNVTDYTHSTVPSHTHQPDATDHTHSSVPSHTHQPDATEHAHSTVPTHTHQPNVSDHTHSTVPPHTHQPNATDHTHSTVPTHTHQPNVTDHTHSTVPSHSHQPDATDHTHNPPTTPGTPTITPSHTHLPDATDHTHSPSAAPEGPRNAESRLHDDILAGYRTDARPVRNVKTAVTVNVKVDVLNIKVFEKDEKLELSSYLYFQWKDEFLQWDPRDFDGLEYLVVKSGLIWLPDVALINSVDGIASISPSPKDRVHIYHDGTVVWTYRSQFAAWCHFDLTYMPRDYHVCDVTVGSIAYTSGYMKFQDLKLLSNVSDVEEWHIEGAKLIKDFQSHPTFTFRIHISRRFYYYVTHIIIPISLLVAISLCCFLLPWQCQERVTMVTLVVLVITVFMLYVEEQLPRSSACVPLLSIYLLTMLGISVANVILSVLVIRLANSSGDVPHSVLSFFRWAAVLVAYQGSLYDKPPSTVLRRQSTGHYLSFKNEMADTTTPCKRHVSEIHSVVTPDRSRSTPCQRHSPIDVFNNTIMSPMRGEGVEVTLVRQIVRYLIDKDAEMKNRTLWKDIAIVVDRYLFIIALLATIIVCVVFFAVIYPEPLDDEY